MSSRKSSDMALLLAVQNMDYALVQKLLNENRLIKDDKWNDYKILIHAVHMGDVKIVELLLSYGCRVKSSRSNSCKTPLCYAVNGNNLEMVSLLLEAGASITDKDCNVNTPLFMAMEKYFYTAVDLMLSKYDLKNINVTNNDEIIHFYIACIRNNVKLIKFFLAHGMNVNTYVDMNADKYAGYSPLHFAIFFHNIKVVELLLSYGANYTFLNEKRMSPLHLIFYMFYFKNSLEKYQIMDYILLNHATDPTNPVDEKGVSHFHIACTRHNKDTVTNFLKNGIDVNYCTLNGCNPLYYAIISNQREIVEILLKHDANVNVKVKNLTLLHIAIENKSPLISKLLLSYGANICTKDDSHCTSIHKAYDDLANFQEIFNTMMSMHQGKMINVTNKNGMSIFHIACAIGDTIVVENFLTRNVDINASLNNNSGEFSGFTALHYAVMNYHEDVVKLLLKYNANVNALDANERSAIWLAVQFIISESIASKLNKKLLKNETSFEGAGVCEKQVMDFMHKEFKKIPIIKLLIENKNNLNRVNYNIGSLLFLIYIAPVIWKVKGKVSNQKFIESICAKYNTACRKEIMEIFIKNGIGFNVFDKNFNSILHLIAADSDNSENLEIAKLLLMNGCNSNFENREGKTALHLAAQKGSLEYVKLLLKYKANPNCTDNRLSTPLHNATKESVINDHNVETRYIKIMQLLLDNEADVDAKDMTGCTPLFFTVHQKKSTRALLCLLKANCLVNIFNNQGQSPLLIAGQKNNACGIKLLLDYGADINFTYGKKEGGILRQVFSVLLIKFEYKFGSFSFIETFKVFEIHLEKLRLINYAVNVSDLAYRRYLQYMIMTKVLTNIFDMFQEEDFEVKSFNIPEQDNFITPMLEEELKKMEDTKIDNYTSLYDILFKNENQMIKHVNNETFNEYLEEETLFTEFQHYGYLLRLKYKQGMKRYVLLEPAKAVMMQLTGRNLPDLCIDNIFVYLSNDNLRNLINVSV